MKFAKKLLLLGILGSIGLASFSKPIESVSAESLYEDEEIMTPIWEGNTSYYESVLVVEEQDGSIKPITLLYDALSIVKVQNARMTTTYTPDVDYSYENGKLVINKSGSIPHLTYHEMHPTSIDELISDDPKNIYEAYSGGYINWHEQTWYHDRQIVVTYTHNEKYNGYVPEGKLQYLPNVSEHIKDKKDMKMLVFGDSISVGKNSSGMYDISPFMPTYPLLFKESIERKYAINISVVNESLSGKTSNWAVEQASKVKERNKGKNFDLILVAFGMNDTFAANKTAKNVQKIVNIFKKEYKNADFILVSTMLPNADCKKVGKHHIEHPDTFKKLEKEGVVLCDLTHVHEYLLTRKAFADMTGNDINHCNDYLARVYAMCLVKTLTNSSYKIKKGLTPLALGLIIGGTTLIVVCSGVACLIVSKKRRPKQAK